jgi:hypothetical protein
MQKRKLVASYSSSEEDKPQSRQKTPARSRSRERSRSKDRHSESQSRAHPSPRNFHSNRPSQSQSNNHNNNSNNNNKKYLHKADREFLEESRKTNQVEQDEFEYTQWLLKEDEFMKKQLIDECKIRIEKKRLKTIDHFVKIMLIYKGAIPIESQAHLLQMRHPKLIIDT